MKGYLLDVIADQGRDLMDLWFMEDSGERSMLAVPYRPRFRVKGSLEDLRRLRGLLEEKEGVRSLELMMGPLDIMDRGPVDFLEVEVSIYKRLKELASEISALGSYRDYSLYDVDLRLPTRFMHENGVFPLARVEVGNGLKPLENGDWTECSLPPLKASVLEIVPEQRGPVRRTSERIRSVRVGDVKMEGEPEDMMISSLLRELKAQDPDVILTYGGDTFGIPYLIERAVVNDLSGALKLDRSGRSLHPSEKEGRSYFSYGRVLYKPPYYGMRGRLHLDLENSFLIREGGMLGVSLLSRMSLLPIQLMARMSPGSAISYMECVEALNRGRSVPWKKNSPEAFKSALELSRSDRGGHIFDPIVGAFSDVVEMDFSSFYPHIMWRKNLSLETLSCPCCVPVSSSGPNTVPGLGYYYCRKEEGLIPSVVGRILSLRMGYKKAVKNDGGAGPFPEEEGLGPVRPPSGASRVKEASNALKWVLVTCFGYTGYKNARFGRIEVHESITSYARDLLLQAKEMAEESGFTLLHGIVDSLWLSGPTDKADELASRAGREIGIPIEVDEVYRWLVFLPNRTNGAGALTRYYGLRGDGTLKFRGIECRQSSTPEFIIRAQEEAVSALSGAGSAEELNEHLPKALDVMRKYGSLLIERDVDPKDLAITIRASRELEQYSAGSEHVAAMKLLKREGVDVHGGQKVRFVVLDHEAKRPEERVALLSPNMGGVRYDVERYLALTARAMESAFSLFGVDRYRALKALKGVEQKGLDDFE